MSAKTGGFYGERCVARTTIPNDAAAFHTILRMMQDCQFSAYGVTTQNLASSKSATLRDKWRLRRYLTPDGKTRVNDSVVLEWKQTTRSTTVEQGSSPEDGIYMQREVKSRAAVSPIISEPGTQMKLKSLRYVWEGEQVRVTADITTSDLLRIEVKAHRCEPAIDFLRQLRSSAATMRAAGGAVSAPLITPPTSVASAKSI